MTKAEWISVIKHTIKPLDESEQYRDPFLERHIQSVYEQMYNELYASSPRGIWKYVRDYTLTNAGDAIDLAEGTTISNLPVDLPRHSGGLFRANSSLYNFFVTDYQGFLAAKHGWFDTSAMKGSYACAIRGDVLYANTFLESGGTVTYSIIPKFTSLGSSDEVMVPGGAEDHFIDRVIDTIQHVPPVDLLNDNA